jgi:hypothetical protein
VIVCLKVAHGARLTSKTLGLALTLRALLFSLILLISCGSENPTGPIVPVCDSSIVVTVSEGAAPVIDWSPDCRLFRILVEADGGSADLWNVFTEGSNAILPPVTYGQLPLGATEATSAEALTSGTTYRVYLFKLTESSSEDGEGVATKAFTP